MNAVGRIGSYITQGVYTVSGPFHPFGGAVDVVVVEQPDGSFKSSPWYVRFGKFQGVLKTREKVVNVNVNGVESDFHMYLDQRGEAYFLREAEGEEEQSVLYPSSSSDEMDGPSERSRRPIKSKSCYSDDSNVYSGDKIDPSHGKIMTRTSSGSRILGLVFGRRSRKDDTCQEEDDGAGLVRITSVDRAEIAANLLEVKWSTNLPTSDAREDNASEYSASDKLDSKGGNDMPTNEEPSQVGSSVYNATENTVNDCVLAEGTGFCDVETGNTSHPCSDRRNRPVEEARVQMLSLDIDEIETSTSDISVLEAKSEVVSEIIRNIDEPSLQSAGQDDNAEAFISGVSDSDSQILDVLQACSSKKFDEDEEQVYDERDVALSGFGISEEVSASSRVKSFIYYETSEASKVGLDGFSEKTHETLYLASGQRWKVPFCAQNLQATVEPPIEDSTDQQAEDIEMECICGRNEASVEVPWTVSKSYVQTVRVDPVSDSVEEVELKSICSTSSCRNFSHQTQDEPSISNKLIRNPSSESYGDSERMHVVADVISIPSPENSEDEQFLFSDLGEFKLSEMQCESKSSDGNDEKNHPSNFAEGITEDNGCSNTTDESYSSPKKFVRVDKSTDPEKLIENLKVTSNPIGIPKVHNISDVEAGRLVESLPNMWSSIHNMDADQLHHPLSHSLDSNCNSLEWSLRNEDESSCVNLDAANGNQLAQEYSHKEDVQNSEDLKNGVGNPVTGTVAASGGGWTHWPFSFRRQRSRKTMQPVLHDIKSFDADNVLESNIDTNTKKDALKSKVKKMMVRAITPTSKQLASLDLKEGRNSVFFTFNTAMLGKQQVDARIYLWKWNTHIVISDVDGTITKSDVLGQFMPLVGVDWSQTGVTHLFSAIKEQSPAAHLNVPYLKHWAMKDDLKNNENGYQLLFLSARAISQAYHTRRFLVNLKQDGKALPDGPVVISPDGLFPSLFREVIRRAPHEFKIACLEDIKALFPSDCNPFYAGFGNRDTDEISYLKVGIPMGKIFIINPKGEVAVNRRVDRKSYSSLHALVHAMFPARTSSEQEDFNTWNFWKLPPPEIFA